MYSFDAIRESNFLYVDKTQYIVDLLAEEHRVIISRPRRFGKSLMVSVLENLFTGNHHLFKGLDIENHLSNPLFAPHPVISLDMSGISVNHGISGVNSAIVDSLQDCAYTHSVKLEPKEPYAMFGNLITRVADKKGKVVILIDEYDCPLRGNVVHLQQNFFRNELWRLSAS
jgi:hypothetical protein